MDRGDRCFFIVDFAAIFEKNIFPFPITPAKLLGDDQAISNGAANTFFLQYIGAATCKKSAKSVAPVHTIGDVNTVTMVLSA